MNCDRNAIRLRFAPPCGIAYLTCIRTLYACFFQTGHTTVLGYPKKYSVIFYREQIVTCDHCFNLFASGIVTTGRAGIKAIG